MTNKSNSEFVNGIDNIILDIEQRRKAWLDYRCGSGMTDIIESFDNEFKHMINMLNIIKENYTKQQKERKDG